MKNVLKGIVACSLLILVAFAGADDYKAQIQKGHDMVSKMALKNDGAGLSKALASFTTKDFVWKEQNGTKLTLAQWQGMMQSQMKMIKVTAWKFTLKDFKQAGNTLTNMTTLNMTATMKNPKTGKPSVVKSVSTARETYVKVGKDWKLKMIESLTDKSTVDGKPMTGGM